MTLPVRAVTPLLGDQMFALLSRHYDVVTRDQFQKDLEEKEWVVLKTSPAGVVAFSTLMRIRTVVDGESIVGFYSGDTVAERAQRGRPLSGGLSAFLQLLFTDDGNQDAVGRRYYLHVAGTARGYLMLPALFRESRPRHDRPLTPDVRRVLTALAAAKGLDFDAERSVVRYERPSLLRQTWTPASRPGHQNPHLRFFMSQNPGFIRGERLASLVHLTRENLTPAAQALLAGTAVR